MYNTFSKIALKNANKDYENLILEFSKLSNIEAILNTSLNIHGYPIVKDARDAIYVFKKTDLDGLILDNLLVLKK